MKQVRPQPMYGLESVIFFGKYMGHVVKFAIDNRGMDLIYLDKVNQDITINIGFDDEVYEYLNSK